MSPSPDLMRSLPRPWPSFLLAVGGGLLVGASQEPVMRILHDVEVRSYSVCETCGEHGSIRTGNWLKVLCESHGYGRESFSRPCIYRNCEHPAVLPGLTCEKHRNATLEEVIAMLGEHDETK